jgi:hypothetical protein
MISNLIQLRSRILPYAPDVTTFVVRVDGEVQTHKFDELGVLVTQQVREVGRVVQLGVNVGDFAVLENITVDARGDVGELSNQVVSVLENVVPVLRLGDTVLISLGEARLVLQSGDSQTELTHGVEGVGATVKDVLNV